MSSSIYSRLLPSVALLFLVALLLPMRAHAQTYWAGDVSISNIVGPPTETGASIAHVALVISNTGPESDTLIAVEVPFKIAEAAGFDALSTRVYRGANLRRSQLVFLPAGETRALGFDDVHLVIYGIRGTLKRGHAIPVRLTFQKAGQIDILVEIGHRAAETVSAPATRGEPKLMKARFQTQPMHFAQAEPERGSAFRCEDGSKLVLSFSETADSLSAVIWLKGDTHTLPYQPPEPGPVQIVWSDGESSLTWSPGVKLMWMSGSTHLMCGRGGHSH